MQRKQSTRRLMFWFCNDAACVTTTRMKSQDRPSSRISGSPMSGRSQSNERAAFGPDGFETRNTDTLGYVGRRSVTGYQTRMCIECLYNSDGGAGDDIASLQKGSLVHVDESAGLTSLWKQNGKRTENWSGKQYESGVSINQRITLGASCSSAYPSPDVLITASFLQLHTL